MLIGVLQGLRCKPFILNLYQRRCKKCRQSLALDVWIMFLSKDALTEFEENSDITEPPFCYYCHGKVKMPASKTWRQFRVCDDMVCEKILDLCLTLSSRAKSDIMYKQITLGSFSLVSRTTTNGMVISIAMTSVLSSPIYAFSVYDRVLLRCNQ